MSVESEKYQGYLEAKTHREKVWDDIAKKAGEYLRGNQWTDQEKAQLTAQHRAPVVNNIILPAVDIILGHFLQNRTDLVAVPVDEYADSEIAEIITAVKKQIENLNRIHDQDKRQFYKGIITGIGVKELWFDTEDDLKGNLKIHYKPSDDFYLDPNTRQYDQSDTRKIHRVIYLVYEEIKRIYGKKTADQIKGGGMVLRESIRTHQAPANWEGESNDYGNLSKPGNVIDRGYDLENNQYRIIECYEKIWEEKDFVYDPVTDDYTDIEGFDKEIQDIMGDNIVKRQMPHIHLTTMGPDGIEIEDGSTGAIEFNQLFNFFFPYWDDGRYMGVVENVFSPQEERNYRHASAIHILSSIAQIGFIYEEGAIKEEDKENISEKIVQNGFNLEVEDGYIDKVRPFSHADMGLISPFLAMEDREDAAAKITSGAKDAIGGMNQKVMSGSAKRHETNQAATQLAGILDNFDESKYLESKAMVWWIQNYYTEERFVRITGINEAPNITNEELVINKAAFGKIANDLSIGQYDFVLEHDGRSKTEREREKFQMIELMRGLPPQYQTILTKFILKSYGFSFANDIQKEFEAMQAFESQQQQMGQQRPPQGGSSAGTPRPARGVRRPPQALQA